MLSQSVMNEFQAHAERLRDAHRERMALVSMKNVVEDREQRVSASIADTLGRRQPCDVYHGDVNLRTLRALLSMVDERGWERCAAPSRTVLLPRPRCAHRAVPPRRPSAQRSPHQVMFHSSFEKCVARVLYREEWATLKPAIMSHNKWERCSSEVMIR